MKRYLSLGAGVQASLCDIVSQVSSEKIRAKGYEP